MSTIRKITIIKKEEDQKILDAQAVEALEINFYDSYIELAFKKDSIEYTMSIKEANNYKIIIE